MAANITTGWRLGIKKFTKDQSGKYIITYNWSNGYETLDALQKMMSQHQHIWEGKEIIIRCFK